MERTLSIIKPNAMKKNVIGKIVSIFEGNGLKIAAIKKIHISKERAGDFYSEHKERPFFGELVDFISSAPVVVMVLEGENAILKNRELMGATNPAEAAEGTIRKLYADSLGENAVHGSDSKESASREVAFFFANDEIF